MRGGKELAVDRESMRQGGCGGPSVGARYGGCSALPGGAMPENMKPPGELPCGEWLAKHKP